MIKIFKKRFLDETEHSKLNIDSKGQNNDKHIEKRVESVCYVFAKIYFVDWRSFGAMVVINSSILLGMWNIDSNGGFL